MQKKPRMHTRALTACYSIMPDGTVSHFRPNDRESRITLTDHVERKHGANVDRLIPHVKERYQR